MKYRFLYLFLSFLIPLQLLAGEISDPLATALCQQKIDCDHPPRLLQEVVSMCEISKKASRCDEFAKENPDSAKLIKKCDVKSYCAQNIQAMQGVEEACWKGYKNALIDLGVSLKGMAAEIAHSWKDLGNQSQKYAAFLKSCDKSLSCRRNAVKSNPQLNKLSDKELMSVPALTIFMGPSKPLGPTEILTPERKRQLLEMGDAAIAAIHKAKVKFNCYTPLAQAELKCYAIGTVFDPTLIAGYAIKMVRVVRAMDQVSGGVRVNAELGVEARALRSGGQFNRAQFVDKYLYFSPTTVAQNQKFTNLALTAKASDKVHFVSFENAEMQNLNNVFLDKNLVTSLTNYHKDIAFRKMETLKKEFPDLEVESYSDYKSARFAFKGQAPPGFQQRVAELFSEANQEFREVLIQNKIIRDTDTPQNWVRGGYGETADQANFAARYSRQQEVNQLQTYSDPGVTAHLKVNFQEAEKLRTDITRAVSPHSPMINGKTLDSDAFNIVRKNAGDPQAIRTALIQRYGLKDVSTKTVNDMERYVSTINQFSPDLYILKREVATLQEAPMGGLSADMVGMGAQNLRATAEALAQSKNADDVLVQSRLMERKVTEEFSDQRGGFQKVVSEAVGAERMKTICSGDDCVSIAKAPLSDTDKSKILQGLADQGYSSKFRLSFIPEGISDPAARTSLGTHGENIEKIVQQNISSQIDPAKLKGLIFGVDMQTTKLNEGSVKLLIGTGKDVQLTASERAQIQQSFKQAVKQMNDDLKAQGIKAGYQARP